jgi:hypothetical protein
MQEPLQPTVAERVMRNIHGLAVLAEELGAFAHGQVPEDDFRVIRILFAVTTGWVVPTRRRGPGNWPGTASAITHAERHERRFPGCSRTAR